MGDGKLGSLLMFVSHCLLWRQQVPQGTTALIFRTGLRTCPEYAWSGSEQSKKVPALLRIIWRAGDPSRAGKPDRCPVGTLILDCQCKPKWNQNVFTAQWKYVLFEDNGSSRKNEFLAPTNSSKYYFTNLPLAYFIDKDFILLRHWFSIIFSQIRLK